MSRRCTRCQQTVPDGDLLCACQVVNDQSADVIARVLALAADFASRGDFATESDLLALCTAYAQVTAERDAAEARYADAVKSGVEIATELATLRADLAAQVEGMTYTTMQTEADEFHGREGLSFVSRDEVLTLLRGPHAD